MAQLNQGSNPDALRRGLEAVIDGQTGGRKSVRQSHLLAVQDFAGGYLAFVGEPREAESLRGHQKGVRGV